MDRENLKKAAAEIAAGYIESGMVVGLGTGSTARYAVLAIGRMLKEGTLKNIICIPTSTATELLAKENDIPLATLDSHPEIEITIDGADEISKDFHLIKGGGGALLREKIIAQASRRNIVIADEAKLSLRLGEKWRLPVEVIPFAKEPVSRYLRELGGTPTVRTNRDASVFTTDEQNIILDTDFGEILHPELLAEQLKRRAGIVEHGLFLDTATDVVLALSERVIYLKRSGGEGPYLEVLRSTQHRN